MDLICRNPLKKAFQSEESRFMLGTALKFCAVSVSVMALTGYILYTRTRLNFFFFEAHGYSGIEEMRDAYYSYILINFVDELPLIFGMFVALFFAGLYLGHMILRPFKVIGHYSAQVINDPQAPWEVEQFADHRLLTRFAEVFFDWLREARRAGGVAPRPVPPHFMGVHKPVTDLNFLFHFGFIILIMVILSVVTIMNFAGDIQENTIQLAIRMLKVDPKIISQFFISQSSVLDELWVMTALIVCTLYGALGLHLYHQVSGAAFGIFATMRSFMKGNYHTRVHLVGFYYLRDSTRSFNKYLDWVEKNLARGPAPR